MNQETRKKLIKNFPADIVKPAPKGKFGKYVPHHLYTQRLVDVIPGGYDFSYDIIRDKDNAIVGARCTLYLKDADQTIVEVGDVDVNAIARNITESEILKLAVSDGIKRCCMRIGLGLELWTGDVTEEEHYSEGSSTPVKKLQEPKTGTSPSSPRISELQLKEMVFVSCKEDKSFAMRCYKDCFNRTKIKTNKDSIELWDDADIRIFLDFVDEYVDKNKDTFEERKNNEPIVNKIIENLDDVQEIKEEEVGERPAPGAWEQEPPSDAQLKPFNEVLNRAADDDVELYEKAKKALNDGTITKGNIFDWINRNDSPWKLQDGNQ